MHSITLSYYDFYRLAETGLNVIGLTEIRRDYNTTYTRFYKDDHMFYLWTLCFDSAASLVMFKLKYSDYITTVFG